MSQIRWRKKRKKCQKGNTGNCVHRLDNLNCKSTLTQHICKHMTGKLGINEKWISFDIIASNFNSQNELEQAIESNSLFPRVKNIYYQISTEVARNPFAAGNGYQNEPENITFLGKSPYRGVLVGGSKRENHLSIFTCFRPTYGNSNFHDFLAKCFLYLERNIKNISWIQAPADLKNQSLTSYAATLEQNFQTQNSGMQHFLLIITNNSKHEIYEFFIWLFNQVESFYIQKNSSPTNENIFMFIIALELLTKLRNNILEVNSKEETKYNEYLCNYILGKIDFFETNANNYLKDNMFLISLQSHLQDFLRSIQENMEKTNLEELDEDDHLYLSFQDFELNLFKCIFKEKNSNQKLASENWEDILQSLFT